MVKPSQTGIKPRKVVGFARHKKDADRLKAGGIRTIYKAYEGETIAHAASRDDVDLVLCDGFRPLGKTSKEIAEAVKAIHARGVRITDLSTCRSSQYVQDAIEMMGEALEAYRPPPEQAAKARAAIPPVERTHKREAKKIWHDPALSVDAKLEALAEWGYTRYWLYSKACVAEGFGKTGNAGRIPNALKKQE